MPPKEAVAAANVAVAESRRATLRLRAREIVGRLGLPWLHTTSGYRYPPELERLRNEYRACATGGAEKKRRRTVGFSGEVAR